MWKTSLLQDVHECFPGLKQHVNVYLYAKKMFWFVLLLEMLNVGEYFIIKYYCGECPGFFFKYIYRYILGMKSAYFMSHRCFWLNLGISYLSDVLII